MSDNPTPEEIAKFEADNPGLAAPKEINQWWLRSGLIALGVWAVAFWLWLRKNVFKTLPLLALLLCASAKGKEIFVSISGSDAADGLTTGTAKQHWPVYMSTYTGAAVTWNPGDILTVKAGDSWGNANLPSLISSGGSTVSQITIRTNGTWGTGHTILDAGGAVVSGTFNSMMQFSANDVDVIGVEFTGLFWDATHNGFGLSCALVGNQTNIHFINCVFTNWSHSTTGGNVDAGACVIGSTTVTNQGCYASNCVFDGGPGADSMQGVYCFPAVIKCSFQNMVSAALPNGNPCVVSNCTIGPLVTSFSGRHGAAIEPQAIIVNEYISGNIIHDSPEENILVGDSLGPEFVFNNIIYNTTQSGITIKWFSGANNTASIWNNAIDTSAFSILSELGTLTSVTEQNNMESGPVSITATTYTHDHNLASLPFGFTAGSLYYNPANSAAVYPGTSAPSSTFTTDFNGVTFNPWYIGPYFYASIIQPPGMSLNGGGTAQLNGGGLINLNN